jgi:DNA-binding MurR/RpiR family transcriptional regulator
MSITELADESGTSAAGVVRLCKRLRMSGFRELKLRITMDISNATESQEAIQIGPGVPFDAIAHSLVHNNEVILHDILKTLDLVTARTAVDVIAASRRISIFAEGATVPVAHDLNLKLLKLGLDSSYNPDCNAQIAPGAGLGENDLAISISYTGEASNVLAAARAAQAGHARTLSLTRFSHNSLAELCDINLFAPSSEPLVKQGEIVSPIALMVIADLLFAGVASLESRDYIRSLTRSYEAGDGLSY